MNESVKIYTDAQWGDFVHCNNCDATMLLPVGEDICPECDFDGCLEWADEDNQEASPELLEMWGYDVEYQ